jgi:hypothetical protein
VYYKKFLWGKKTTGIPHSIKMRPGGRALVRYFCSSKDFNLKFSLPRSGRWRPLLSNLLLAETNQV